MIISSDQFVELCDAYAGYCPQCNAVVQESGVEPDAKNYHCDECGGNKMMGMEMALILNHLEFED